MNGNADRDRGADRQGANRPRGDGLAARTETYREVYRATRDHRAACAAYCAGNVHLLANARGCGNLP